MRTVTATAWLVMMAACGPSERELLVTPPMAIQAAPVAPQLTCRPDWQPIDVLGVQACEPFPEGRATCVGASRQRHGASDCEALAVCAEDGWATGLPEDTVYVKAGETGNGSRDAPYGSLQQALDGSATTIAVAAGTYTGRHTLSTDRRIVGNCPDQTTLLGEDGEPAITVQAGQVALQGLRISSPGGTALRIEAGHVDAQALWIDDAADVGVYMIGPEASATVSRSLFTRIANAEDGSQGYGIHSEDGAVLLANDLTFRGGHAGLHIEAEATIEEATFVGFDGRGITVFSGDLTLVGAVFQDATGSAIVNINGRLDAADIVIRRLNPSPAPFSRDPGIEVLGRSDVWLTRAHIHQIDGRTISLLGDGDLVGQDLLLEGGIAVYPQLGVEGPGAIDAQRVHISITGNSSAVYVSGEGTAIYLRDAVVDRNDGLVSRDSPLLSVSYGTLLLENAHVIEQGFAPEWLRMGWLSNVTMRDVSLVGQGIGTAFFADNATPVELTLERVHVSRAAQVFDLRNTNLTATSLVTVDIQGDIGTLVGGEHILERSSLTSPDGGLSLVAADIELTDVSLSTTQGTGIELDEQSTLRGSRIRLHNIGSIGIFSEGQVDLNNVQLDASDLGGDVGIHSVGEFADLLLSDYRITGFTTPILDEGARAILE